MSTEKRKYQLKARAKRQQATRQRIVEAAMALHEEVGPAQTTVAEIARRAGVQRLTVYNHFPGDRELFAACSGHYIAAHPPPDFERAFALEDPRDRVREVLRLFYGWYRETEKMTVNIQRDRLLVPAVEERTSALLDTAIAEVASALTGGFGRPPAQADRIGSMLGIALDFWTWRRLKLSGLDDAAAADLMADAISAIANDESGLDR